MNSCDRCYKESENKKRRDKLLDPEVKLLKKLKDRKNQWKSRYGVSPEQIDSVLKDQDYKCANPTCQIPIHIDNDKFTTKAVIDHDHRTGKFRALLCQRCNLILGYIEKQEGILSGLLKYLGRFNSNNEKGNS